MRDVQKLRELLERELAKTGTDWEGERALRIKRLRALISQAEGEGQHGSL